MQRIAGALVRHRFIFLTAVVLLTVFFYDHYRRLGVEYGAEKMLGESNPQRVAFEKFLDHFEIEEFFVVTFESDEIFTGSVLENIDFLAQELSEIGVDRTGQTFDTIKKLQADLRAKRWLLAKLPKSFGKMKAELSGKVDDLQIDLDRIRPPQEYRVGVVNKVTTILNATDVRVEGDTIEIGPTAENGEPPLDDQEIESFRKRVLGNPTFRNSLISADGKTTAIMVALKTYTADKLLKPGDTLEKQKEVRKFVDGYRREITAYAERILAQQKAVDDSKELRIDYYLAGGPIFTSFYIDAVERDASVFFPLTLLVIGFVLILINRNLRGIVLPISVVLISYFWTFGLIDVVGGKMTLVSTILFPLILVIGMAVVIHIVNQYYEEIARAMADPKNAVRLYLNEKKPEMLRPAYREAKLELIRKAIGHVLPPCFWTSLTTALGFLSLAASKVIPVRETGLFAAFGIFATFIVAIVLTPTLLSFLPIPTRSLKKPFETGILASTQRGVAWLNERGYKVILIASAALLVLSVAGMSKLSAETNLREYFKPDSPIRVAHKFMEERLSGVTTIEFAIDAKHPDALKEPEILNAIERFQDHLESYNVITKTFSLADTVKMMNKAMNEDRDEAFTIPETRAAVAQYLLLYEQDASLSSIVNTNYSYSYVGVRLHNMSSRDIRLLTDRIVAEIPRIFSGLDVAVTPSGGTWLAVLLERYIVEGQIESFALAMLVISILLFFILRSKKLGLVAILPNLLPILMTMGFMGLVGIPINMATCMMPSIAIGIAVDDTIHFLSRYRREIKNGLSVREACRKTLTTTGQAMILTSIVLAAGFGILLFSTFNPNIHFGSLTALTMLTALLADMFVLPSLLIALDARKTRFDQHK
jgi:uncharacterized protein